jgi:peptide/nickel transport system substrate-binding protein
LLLALVAGLSTVAAACGGDEEAAPAPPAETTEPAPPAETGETTEPAPPATEPEPPVEAPGGTIRADWESAFGFTNNLDPTGEYLGEAFMLFQATSRTLLGYRHVAGAPGNELIPDLAVDQPVISDDGLTWTFTLKDGIKFGPPLSREITSRDVAYAFERIGTQQLAAQYGFYYYDTIAGMREFYDGEADSISGIETPDDKTIVFTLTAPRGDFGYLVGMPAATPIPEEIASCFVNPGDYGRFLISSGPYMIEGSDALDLAAFASCDTAQPLSGLTPISGYEPDQILNLVRNPDYDPTTDTPEARSNLVDRFEFTVNTNTDDIFAKVEAGELDFEVATEPPQVLQQWADSDRLNINIGDRTWYLTMNLTQPPFDDIHVRKAVNLVMDKEALRQAWGGPISGPIATHIIPDPVLADALVGYDPYPGPDLDAAKAEMAQSKYDTDGDGVCDAPECAEVLMIADKRGIDDLMVPVVEEALLGIGIQLVTRQNTNAYTIIQTVNKNVPISSRPGWGKDYADASTFFDPLFTGAFIIPEGNTNYSLVGITAEQAAGFGGFNGNAEGVPSIDADLKACQGTLNEERIACYAGIDQKLMEEVVPWVPYLWSNSIDLIGPAVNAYQFDQFSGNAALVHMGVDPSLQN